MNFRIDLNQQTLVFNVYNNRLPQLIYWGVTLPDNEDLISLANAAEQNVPLAQISEISRISLAPELGWGFQGHPGIELTDDHGNSFYTQFKFVDFTKTNKSNSESVEFKFISEFIHVDKHIKLINHFIFSSDGMLTSSNQIENLGEVILVKWLSAPVIHLPQSVNKIQLWGGKWIKEFQKEEINIPNNSILLRENRRGRTSHESVPAAVFPLDCVSQTSGQAYAFNLAWSGNHRLLVENLHDGNKQFQIGSLEELGEVRLKKGEFFSTPKLYGCFTSQGINGIRNTFHSHLRNHLIRHRPDKEPRKVHCNSWEAIYFDHNFDKLKKLIDEAEELGAERFVLDDGWFLNRNDDTTSLGDWEVDKVKFPKDLFPLIDYVKSKGMDFGLWLEPEMININSNLFRTHPDWVLHPPNLKRIEGRHQLVLDLTNNEVLKYLFETISGLIKKYSLAYIKWDHNRILISNQTRKQTEALYQLLDKLKSTYPDTDIESCSSGGGRIDLGILNWADRFWASDSNDPLERWKMQFEISTFFPPEIIGSHVGPQTCHTSNRITPIDFRSLVSISSHFGYECDLTELNDEDKLILKEATSYYKLNRLFFHQADVFALNPMTENQTYGLSYVSQDKGKFILFFGVLESENNSSSPIIQLPGLDESYNYHLIEKFGSEKKNQLNQITLNHFSSKEGFILSGKCLQELGIRIPISMPLTIWVLEGNKI